MELAHLLNRVRTSHWLEQWGRRRAGGGERARQRETLKRRFSLSFFFPPSLHFLTSLPRRLWKGSTKRETQSRRDKGGKAERMKANVRVSDSVCSVLRHAGVTTAASPIGVVGCQEKECFPVEWVPEPVHHVDVGQQFPNLCRKNPTEKRAGTGEQGWSCVSVCELVLLRLFCLKTLDLTVLPFHVSFFIPSCWDISFSSGTHWILRCCVV